MHILKILLAAKAEAAAAYCVFQPGSKLKPVTDDSVFQDGLSVAGKCEVEYAINIIYCCINLDELGVSSFRL